LDSHHERAVSPRVQRTGVPSVRSPYRSPTVVQLEPVRGPAGTEITLRGRNLAGWPLTLSVAGKTLIDAVASAGDTVTSIVPADLQPGVHEVLVDVARLHQRVFRFEVSA
jgi:hypothetical protein